MAMLIRVEEMGDVTVLALLGELDVFTSPDLIAQFKRLHDLGRYEVLIDLAELDFFDSTGLGAFVGARKKAHEHGVGFGLVTAHAPFLAVLRITGLDRIFDVYPSVLDAMAARAARADGGSGLPSAK